MQPSRFQRLADHAQCDVTSTAIRSAMLPLTGLAVLRHPNERNGSSPPKHPSRLRRHTMRPTMRRRAIMIHPRGLSIDRMRLQQRGPQHQGPAEPRLLAAETLAPSAAPAWSMPHRQPQQARHDSPIAQCQADDWLHAASPCSASMRTPRTPMQCMFQSSSSHPDSCQPSRIRARIQTRPTT